ncbi:MAG: hypothetical protein H6618_07925 [Deltaproteobacteria bacterium]|nr:hypothetical protein [Deltaproteobacteria bacterium]
MVKVWLTVIFSLMLSCSPQLTETNANRPDNGAEALDQIEQRDSSGQVTELQGFAASENLQPTSADGNVTTEAFDQGIQENKEVFSFQSPTGFEPEFSEPVVVTGSSLWLSSDSANLTPSADVCSSLSYQKDIPKMKDMVTQVIGQGICGTIDISFCIRLSSQVSGSSLTKTVSSPSFTMSLPCPDQYFSSVTAKESSQSNTSTSVVFERRELVDRVFLAQDASCTEGDWIALSGDDAVGYSGTTDKLYAKFGDVFGQVSTCREIQIQNSSLAASATTTPTGNSIQINAGAEYATSSSVTLQLQSSGASEMLVSDAADCSSGTWETYSTSRSWTLSKTNTTALVYVMFRNTVGQSSCISDSIIHDNTGPSSGSVTIGSSNYTASLKNTLFLSSTGASQMYITNTAGCASGGSWESYATTKTQWSLGSTNAETHVYAKFKDVYGNESSCVSDAIWHDDTAPASPSGLSDGTKAVSSSTTATISWTAATDNLSGIQAYELSVGSSAGDTDIKTWTSVGNVTSHTFSDLSLTIGHSYYVNIRALDAAGNVSTVSSSDGFYYGFIQESYVKSLASGSSNNSDQFGQSTAVSGDTLVVGSINEDCNQTSISALTGGASLSCDDSLSNSGAVWVYRKSGNSWSAEAFIKPSNAGSGDNFGTSVAISGDTLVVGAPYEDSNQTTVTNGASASSDDSNADSGAVYIFSRSGTTWTQSAYLKAPNNDAGDLFGQRVAIDGDTVIIGATGEDAADTTITNGTTASADNTATDKGAAYIFRKTAGVWAQEAYLKALQTGGSTTAVGQDVDIEGDTAIISSHKANCKDTIINSSVTDCSTYGGSSYGAVWVFKRSGTTWVQEAYLSTPVLHNGDLLGNSIAISGDTIVAGADGEDSASGTIINGSSASADTSLLGSGAAYVFVRSGSTWSQQAFLKASNPHASASFGKSVDIQGDSIVVGAFAEASSGTSIVHGTTSAVDSGTYYGAAYVFQRSGTSWSQAAFLKVSNMGASDNLAESVAMDSQSIVLGSPLEDSAEFTTINTQNSASSDDSGSDVGAVYVISR